MSCPQHRSACPVHNIGQHMYFALVSTCTVRMNGPAHTYTPMRTCYFYSTSKPNMSTYTCEICAEDLPIEQVHKCSECQHVYCYNCLATHIMEYSNVQPHCFNCNVKLSFEPIYKALTTLSGSTHNTVRKYISKAAKQMFEVEEQKIPMVMSVCRKWMAIKSIPNIEEYSKIFARIDPYEHYYNNNEQWKQHKPEIRDIIKQLFTSLDINDKLRDELYSKLHALEDDDYNVKELRQFYVETIADILGLQNLLTEFGTNDFYDIFRYGRSPEWMLQYAINGVCRKDLGKAVTVKYLFRCSMNDCNGYVNNKYVCELCGTKYCAKCWKPICEQAGGQSCGQTSEQAGEHTMQSHDVSTTDEHTCEPSVDTHADRTCKRAGEGTGGQSCKHTCDPEDVHTVEVIKSSTKPCPKCAARIQKSMGCSQMFCTSCHTGFDYNTGKIITSNFHNPHRIEWLQSLRLHNMSEFEAAGNCDEFHFINSYSSKLNWYYGQRNHAQQMIAHYRENMTVSDFDMYFNLCMYVTNEISKKQYKQILKQICLQQKKLEILEMIYNEYNIVVTDILRCARHDMDKMKADLTPSIRDDMNDMEKLYCIVACDPEVLQIIYENVGDTYRNFTIEPNELEHLTSLYRSIGSSKIYCSYRDIICVMQDVYDNIIVKIIDASQEYVKAIESLIDYTNQRLTEYEKMFGDEMNVNKFAKLRNGEIYMYRA